MLWGDWRSEPWKCRDFNFQGLCIRMELHFNVSARLMEVGGDGCTR